MQETLDAPDNRVRHVSFPWLTVLGGMLVVTYLLLMSEPALQAYYSIPASWFTFTWFTIPVKYILLGTYTILLLVDVRRYHRQRLRQKRDTESLRDQVNDLWQSKKQLQLKAHTYSGHADKLKLFISDKLLDYIEYDEKFLHFKSIAAEVRHNGVISFDKVQSALHQVAASLSEEGNPQPDVHDVQDALNAMRYLWDLLDLSTADNLALHIGNLLCECEEHYYQRMLNIEDAAPLPYDPVYSPQRAAWRALGLVRAEAMPVPHNEDQYQLQDGQWYIHLAPVNELLGNENHLILLLENLLKNAQFFSNKRGYKSAFAPIALTLAEHKGHASFKVYNRGPHINDDDRPNLFQLGFSTRRVREHHGRGLGLYFVGEIVKGYEGRIDIRNVFTPEAQYTVRLELDNDEVITDLINVVVIDEQPQCRAVNGDPLNSKEWVLESPLRSVEITTTNPAINGGRSNTQRLSEFASKGKQSRYDPAHPASPHWQIHYQPKRNAHQLSFDPLNINGVEFEIQLPTAQLRLDNEGLELDDDIEAEVAQLDERFRSKVS